jgi:cytochrome c-type biogenesis protein CcmF
MFSWFFLSLGLTLGMIWAYEELGWGGYWGWDRSRTPACCHGSRPPAFLHSVMVQERRGMLRVWNVTLGHHHVPADDRRHIPDALGRRAVDSRVR